jgi:NAD(P)-dependent dehydrogenase (short-subunit alcohol dehydrogenase family)
MKITTETAAIVTGGASGLGLATAKALAAAGARVAIFDLNSDAGKSAAHDLNGTFCEVDITSEESVLAGFDMARAAHGQERVLVNCAGGGKGRKIISRDKTTGEIRRYATTEFNNVVQLNLIGTFRCTAIATAGMAALEPLSNGERGVVTCTSSVAAVEGQIGQASYSASKAAIAGMTLTLARDLSSEGIRINTILPGIFATPPMLGVAKPVLDALSASVPFPKRLGNPDEFASLVLELIRNGYLNGETLRLDGAIRMPPR